ncbi:hypothetical protein NQ318_019503 [Aromia moschata]|uniref:DUF5641 domain-containing protein n=1 Tax=Aromia moschata TaxID=1265417 RepID=A0AAV8XXQ2_9CUCU|nr:hypothetical protein NQ318_019503 [Aromia moschata]
MTEINNLEKLIRKRAVAKGNLTRFKNFLDNLDANNPDLLELEQAFCDIQLEIDILDDNPNDHEQERQTFENDYFKYEAMARRLLNLKLAHNSFGVVSCLIRMGQISLGKHNPILQNTALGWVISGEIVKSKINRISTNCNFVSTNDIDNNLRKFWELEEKATTLPLSQEEQSVEDYFKATTYRGSDGKFVVRLPLKQLTDIQMDENLPQLLKVDSLVIIKDEKLPVLTWTLGRVLQLHPGRDGVVRVVTLETATSVYKRPVNKLCVAF